VLRCRLDYSAVRKKEAVERQSYIRVLMTQWVRG
jgi:hypothetical protein